MNHFRILIQLLKWFHKIIQFVALLWRYKALENAFLDGKKLYYLKLEQRLWIVMEIG